MTRYDFQWASFYVFSIQIFLISEIYRINMDEEGPPERDVKVHVWSYLYII